VKEAFGGKPGRFRACAYFDDRLDCIRVIARDCSILETRINQRITILEDNSYSESGDKKYVGFTVKGARHFCQEHNFSLSAPIDMSALLDAIVASFPEVAVELFVKYVAKPLVKQEKIKRVDVSGALPQLA
jgi:hypothetical protein